MLDESRALRTAIANQKFIYLKTSIEPGKSCLGEEITYTTTRTD